MEAQLELVAACAVSSHPPCEGVAYSLLSSLCVMAHTKMMTSAPIGRLVGVLMGLLLSPGVSPRVQVCVCVCVLTAPCVSGWGDSLCWIPVRYV